MKISVIFFFIISFFSFISASPRTVYCNGVRNGCHRGCTHMGYSAMAACRRQCDTEYRNCLRYSAEA